MKISEAFDRYKNKYMLIKRLSRRSLENNDYVKKRIVEIIGDKDISDFTMDDLAKYAAGISTYHDRSGKEVERKTNTIRNNLIRLKMVLKYVRSRGQSTIDPELLPIPKRQDVIRPFLTADEVGTMLDNAYSLRNKLVISLLYSSGIRLSEMIALDRDSIRNGCFQVVGKGSKMRLCFIDVRTEKIMNEYLDSRDDDCPALIVSYKNKSRMTPTNVQLLVKNTGKRAGLTKMVTPHILRHSFATNFLKNNGNIRYLSTMLGHSSVSTTMVYAHVTDNDLREQYIKYHTV